MSSGGAQGARWVGVGVTLAVAVVVLDQLTKWLILDTLSPLRPVIEIAPFFNLVLTWNRGVSFGLFNNDSPYNSVVLIVVALAVAVALLIWLWRADHWRIRLALGSIMGGAIGNAIDRFRHDAVVDFLDVHVGGLHWPAFNVADSAITVGAILLVIDALFSKEDSSTNTN